MSIVDTLARDHRELETEMASLANCPSSAPADRVTRFGQLQSLLQAHARAEEEAVYRPLRARAPEESKVLDAYEEHHVADILLQELAADCPGGAGWGAKMRVLHEVVSRHVKDEEQLVFTLLQEHFYANELETMVADFESIKHQKVEALLGTVRRATPAFAGRATVTAQAAAGRYMRRGALYLRRHVVRNKEAWAAL